MNPLNATGHLTLLYVDWCMYESESLTTSLGVLGVIQDSGSLTHRGARDQTTNLANSRWPGLPTKPQGPLKC